MTNIELIVIGLLTIIALSSINRIWIVLKPFGKVAYFKGKFKGTERLIWDLQFKRFKTLEIREDVRKEYDYMQSRIASIEEDIKNFKGEKADKAVLEEKKILAEKDRDRLKNQVDQLDAEVYGAKPSQANPQGVIGLDEQMDSMVELKGMLKDYIKGGCKEG